MPEPLPAPNVSYIQYNHWRYSVEVLGFFFLGGAIMRPQSLFSGRIKDIKAFHIFNNSCKSFFKVSSRNVKETNNSYNNFTPTKSQLHISSEKES